MKQPNPQESAVIARIDMFSDCKIQMLNDTRSFSAIRIMLSSSLEIYLPETSFRTLHYPPQH